MAVDVSSQMLDQLRQKHPDDDRFALAESSVDEYLAGTDNADDAETFDLITAVSVFPFMSEPHIAIEGVAQRLSAGGLFVFTYDPFIEGHPVQGEAQELIRHAASGPEITVHRRHPLEIREAILHSGLALIQDQPYSPLPQSDLEARMVVTGYLFKLSLAFFV